MVNMITRAPIDDRIVVSLTGEQWSPKTPPPATAAKHIATSVVTSLPDALNAKGNAIGIQIAKVPQELPVANAMIAETTKITAGSNAGVRKDSVILIIKLAVPISLLRLFSGYANASKMIAGIAPL